jgi:hypothetical protein
MPTIATQILLRAADAMSAASAAECEQYCAFRSDDEAAEFYRFTDGSILCIAIDADGWPDDRAPFASFNDDTDAIANSGYTITV